MNPKTRRFVETTFPSIIVFGMIVAFSSVTFGWGIGVIAILLYAIVDVLMTTQADFVPKNIHYDGEYFRTLIELIDYVKDKEKKKKLSMEVNQK